MAERIDMDSYFMEIAKLVAQRSTCLHHNMGAIIVRDKHLLTTGYNGSARGQPHCLDVGCLKDEQGLESGTGHEICRAIHAEQNAIIQAALHGVSTEGATLYCTHQPCGICAKIIVNAGITRVVYCHPYPDPEAESLMRNSGIKLTEYKG